MNPQDLTVSSPLPYSKTAQPQLYRDLRPRGFKWVKAATKLASGLPATEVAKELEVSSTAILRWKRDPRFQKLLAHYEQRVADEALKTGLASKNYRLSKQNKRWNTLHTGLDSLPTVTEQLPVMKEIRELERLVAQDVGGMFSPQVNSNQTNNVQVNQFMMLLPDAQAPPRPKVIECTPVAPILPVADADDDCLGCA